MPIYTDGLGISATALGQNDAAATADGMGDIATTPAQAKVRLILNRLGTNAFTATIQGAARTELDVMLNTLATYFSAAGAAYSSVVDPGGATRTEIETVLEDIAAMLAGTAGITTYPSGAAPGNGVSLAEAIRYISENIGLEGATALANKLTAARAALLDEITAVRLAELSAANLPADVDTLLARLTAARAALLDEITAVRMAELGATNLPADIDAILADTGTDGVVVNSRTAAFSRLVGVKQILEVSVTSAANAGDVTLATVTTQPCLIKSVVIHSDTASQTDLTSAAVAGGASKVVVFLSATDAAAANINAVDEQVAWTGAVRLAATKTIVISLVGTGATAVDLTVTIEYEACVAGGYLA